MWGEKFFATPLDGLWENEEKLAFSYIYGGESKGKISLSLFSHIASI